MNEGKEGGSNDWTKDGSNTTKKSHYNGREGKLDIECVVGINIILIGAMDRTCQPHNKSAEDKSNNLIPGGMDAQCFCCLFILSNGHEAKTKLGGSDFKTDDDRHKGQKQN